jgi:hypothetical protein
MAASSFRATSPRPSPRARMRDDRQPAGRHRREPRRDHSLSGPHVQDLSRHGIAGRHGIRAMSTVTRRTPTQKLVPEGIEGRVAAKGPLADLVYQLVGGLKSGMGYCGARPSSRCTSEARFLRVSPAGLAREPRARRHHYQGSAELPDRVAQSRLPTVCQIFERENPHWRVSEKGLGETYVHGGSEIADAKEAGRIVEAIHTWLARGGSEPQRAPIALVNSRPTRSGPHAGERQPHWPSRLARQTMPRRQPPARRSRPAELRGWSCPPNPQPAAARKAASKDCAPGMPAAFPSAPESRHRM